MKTTYVVSSFIAILVFLIVSSVSFAAPTSNCITCHTNDSIIKSLYKPPAMPEGEGEG
ncbi:MAG: hypothetical protein PHN75_04625 [Syntrophales bacterium]|nr:hypothetical protein [Syntrophales bacterium]